MYGQEGFKPLPKLGGVDRHSQGTSGLAFSDTKGLCIQFFSSSLTATPCRKTQSEARAAGFGLIGYGSGSS